MWWDAPAQAPDVPPGLTVVLVLGGSGPGALQVPPHALPHPAQPQGLSCDGVTSPTKDQLWAVSTHLPTLAPGQGGWEKPPSVTQGTPGCWGRQARRTELEGTAPKGEVQG